MPNTWRHHPLLPVPNGIIVKPKTIRVVIKHHQAFYRRLNIDPLLAAHSWNKQSLR